MNLSLIFSVSLHDLIGTGHVVRTFFSDNGEDWNFLLAVLSGWMMVCGFSFPTFFCGIEIISKTAAILAPVIWALIPRLQAFRKTESLASCLASPVTLAGPL